MDNLSSPTSKPNSRPILGTENKQFSDNTSSELGFSTFHDSTLEDVLMVKELFVKAKKLPIELVDMLMDFAEYWPHTTVTTKTAVRAAGGSSSENNLILRSFPLGYIPRDIDIDNTVEPNRGFPSFKKVEPVFADSSEEKGQRPIRKHLVTQDGYRPDTRKWPRNDSGQTQTSEATTKLLESWSRKSTARTEHPCRKIVFTIKSHDQGWGGSRHNKGSYDGSKTWFDIGLERIEIDAKLRDQGFTMPYGIPAVAEDGSPLGDPVKEGEEVPCILRTYDPAGDRDRIVDGMQERFYDHPFEPHPATLQINRLATNNTQEFVIELRYDDAIEDRELEKMGRGEATGNGSLVNSLKVGDVVTVWARARFGGWINYVEEVKVDIYWAV